MNISVYKNININTDIYMNIYRYELFYELDAHKT